MRIPTTGATPSHTPKMADVLTDVEKVGLSPPSTSELRKLSRLRTNPSVSSPNTKDSSLRITRRARTTISWQKKRMGESRMSGQRSFIP